MAIDNTEAREHTEQVADLLKRLRIALQPKPGDADYRVRHCSGCGQRYVKPAAKRGKRCAECSAKRLIAANAQMIAKSGPVWEAAVAANVAIWLAEFEKIGLQLPDRQNDQPSDS
jgi:DNA-directed RNA polymerase subunit RPC12/RpoP